MKIIDLNKEYDRLQEKYGARELNSIYNGGCENNPDVLFIFMNPTGRNVTSLKSWNVIGSRLRILNMMFINILPNRKRNEKYWQSNRRFKIYFRKLK